MARTVSFEADDTKIMNVHLMGAEPPGGGDFEWTAIATVLYTSATGEKVTRTVSLVVDAANEKALLNNIIARFDARI